MKVLVGYGMYRDSTVLCLFASTHIKPEALTPMSPKPLEPSQTTPGSVIVPYLPAWLKRANVVPS